MEINLRFSKFVLKIEVIEAFRMNMDADSFDRRSLSSRHSVQSLQAYRMQAFRNLKSTSHDADGTMNQVVVEEVERV